jgi:putative protease
MTEKKIGRITHYFGKISVAIIELTDDALSVGDTIHVKGHTADFTQQVESMQIEHNDVPKAEIGQSIGLKVIAHAHEHDIVYKVMA